VSGDQSHFWRVISTLSPNTRHLDPAPVPRSTRVALVALLGPPRFLLQPIAPGGQTKKKKHGVEVLRPRPYSPRRLSAGLSQSALNSYAGDALKRSVSAAVKAALYQPKCAHAATSDSALRRACARASGLVIQRPRRFHRNACHIPRVYIATPGRSAGVQ